jgi:transcriptional regulator with XRE-family HTH domain
MNKKEFGYQVRSVRKSKNFTVDKLSEALNKSPDNIRQIESGARTTTMQNFLIMCKVLGVMPSDLLKNNINKNLECPASEYAVLLGSISALSKEELNYIEGIIDLTISNRSRYREK